MVHINIAINDERNRNRKRKDHTNINQERKGRERERERIKKTKKFSTCACVFLFSRALSKVIPRYCSRDGWTGGTIVLLSPLFWRACWMECGTKAVALYEVPVFHMCCWVGVFSPELRPQDNLIGLPPTMKPCIPWMAASASILLSNFTKPQPLPCGILTLVMLPNGRKRE